MADTFNEQEVVDSIRRQIGGALQQIGNDLMKLDRVSRSVAGSSGGVGILDGTFATMATRLLGPVGLVAGLYQVSNALTKVAASSVEMQAFSRNTGMASDNIKDFQLQLQMMGKSSSEAKNTIASLNGILNNFETYKESSNLSQTMFGREGGAAFLNRLSAAKDRLGQIDEILKTYRSGDDRQKRGLADVFTGGDLAALDNLVTKSEVLRFAFKTNDEELRKFYQATVLFDHNMDQLWKNIAGNAIVGINKITEGADGQANIIKNIASGVNAFVDEGLARIKTTIAEFNAIKAYLESLPENFRSATGIGQKYRGVGNDPIGADNAAGQFGEAVIRPGTDPMGEHGKGPSLDGRFHGWLNRRSGIFSPETLRSWNGERATDFGGMRRTQSIEEDQSRTLVDIRDILSRMEGGPKSSSGGGSSGSGGSSGGTRYGFGSANGGGGAGLTASRGATNASTAKAMEYAKDQLRKEGVPEANLNHAAALLVGQAQAESGLNPNLEHDGGTGYGIYGARLDRKTGMLNWLKENGYAPNSLEGQMRHMAREAMTGKDYGPSRQALMGASDETMASGTQTLTRNFERPAVDNSSTRLGHARAALNGGIVPQPGTGDSAFGGLSFGGDVRENQGNAIRRGAIDPRLRTAFDYASSKTGLTVDINSGGQRMPGAPGATGSHRHDGGRAADFLLRDADGKVVSPNDPRALEFYRYAGQGGVTGGGHSYGDMGSRTHLDIDSPGVYAGGAAFRRALEAGRSTREEFVTAARARMDAAKNSGTQNSLNAKVEFTNVPPGVKTSVESEGEIFKDLQVSKSRQNEVAGGSPGQPFAGVW